MENLPLKDTQPVAVDSHSIVMVEERVSRMASRMETPMPPMAATIWLSVKAEMKMPTAMREAATKVLPSRQQRYRNVEGENQLKQQGDGL